MWTQFHQYGIKTSLTIPGLGLSEGRAKWRSVPRIRVQNSSKVGYFVLFYGRWVLWPRKTGKCQDADKMLMSFYIRSNQCLQDLEMHIYQSLKYSFGKGRVQEKVYGGDRGRRWLLMRSPCIWGDTWFPDSFRELCWVLWIVTVGSFLRPPKLLWPSRREEPRPRTAKVFSSSSS